MTLRSSREPRPLYTVKRAPEILWPRSKSRMSSFSPRSQWDNGSKSNLRGSPQRRTSGLSASLLPTGTSSAGMLGMASMMVFNRASISRRRTSSAAILSPMARTSAIFSSAFSPAFFSLPISLDAVLRSFFSASTCWVISRRSLSSARNSSRFSSPFLLRTASITFSGLSRTNFISNILTYPPLCCHSSTDTITRAEQIKLYNYLLFLMHSALQ